MTRRVNNILFSLTILRHLCCKYYTLQRADPFVLMSEVLSLSTKALNKMLSQVPYRHERCSSKMQQY